MLEDDEEDFVSMPSFNNPTRRDSSDSPMLTELTNTVTTDPNNVSSRRFTATSEASGASSDTSGEALKNGIAADMEGTPSEHSRIIKDYSKKGILAKKGMGKLFKPWTLRTVYVDLNQRLAYFDGTTLKGEILLDGVSVRSLTLEEADGRPFAFEISNINGVRRTQNNMLVLAASSAQEAQEWIDCLRSAACSTVRQRAMIGPGYMSLSAEIKGSAAAPSSDMDNVKRLRELRQQQKEKKLEACIRCILVRLRV
jgi:hypothetical protein